MKDYPHFNVDNLPLKVNNDYMAAVVAEENRVCAPIDKRIGEVENEYLAMGGKLKVLADKVGVGGLFARWRTQGEIKTLGKRMLWHRAVLARLYNERWKRTYG